jgi:hypothetical protein
MPHGELHRFSDDRSLLITMCASVNDARHIVRRTLELIEQSQIMLRELDIHGGRWPTSLVNMGGQPAAGRARPHSPVQSDRQPQKVRPKQQHYYNLLELARICSRQANSAQTEDIARTLHRMAREYVQEAGKLDDGKILDINWFV